MFRKIRRYFRDPYYSLGNDLIKKHPKWMSDKFYLSVLWKMEMGYEIDWKHPKTFNEKLQWLKLNNRVPLYTTLVDKFRVKQWVAERIGERHVIPTLACYDSVNDIDLVALPNQFVLKCNHDSGSVVICKDKASFDLEAAKKKLGEAMERNFYWEAREWPYKNVKPCIFAEKYLEDESGGLTDYKVSCFNGVPYKVMVCSDRYSSETTKFYSFDKDWTLLRHNKMGKAAPDGFSLPKPKNFDEMMAFSSLLSKDIPFVRVDFYEAEGVLFFGELTFFPEGGFDKAILKETDDLYGEMIKLPAR